MKLSASAHMLSPVNKEIIWNGTKLSETDTGKETLQRQDAELLIQKQQTIQRQFTVKRANLEILHRHKLSAGICGEINVEKILVNIELIPRYTIPPCMVLPI